MNAAPGQAEETLIRKQSEEIMGTPAPKPVYLSPWAYLRTMLLVAWSTFRHPFATTTIDLNTGECVHEG